MQLLTLKHARLLAAWFIVQLKASDGDDKIVFGQNRWRDENKKRGSVIQVRTQESQMGNLLEMITQEPRIVSVYVDSMQLQVIDF